MKAIGFGNLKRALFIFTVLFVQAFSLQSRSVNLAVETSFLFDPQDITENTTFINNVQNVIDKIKNVLLPSNKPVFRQSPEREQAVLTNFLAEIGSYLITFDNNDIKKITSDLNDVVQSHMNKVEFNEMVEDIRLRAFLKNTVKEWSLTDPMILKVEIAKYITSIDTDSIVQFIQLLNKFFDTADEAKFKKLLKKFTKAKQKKEFSKFLSKTIDFVLFKRYKKMNYLLKQILKQEMKKLADYVNVSYSNRTKLDNVDFRRLTLSSVARSQDFPSSEILDSSNSVELSIRTENRKNNDQGNEIIIDKDLQLNVRANDQTLSLNVT